MNREKRQLRAMPMAQSVYAATTPNFASSSILHQGNRPVCIRKSEGDENCVTSRFDRTSVHPVAPLESLAPLMANLSVGSLLPLQREVIRYNETHAAFAVPRGMRFLGAHNVFHTQADQLNEELGRDDVWLPVSHTMTTQHPLQVGLWFFYMRGCSDFMWNAGRTLLALNKCDAVIELERRALLATHAAAVESVARRLVAAVNQSTFEQAWTPFERRTCPTSVNQSSFRRRMGGCTQLPLKEVMDLLASCGRGDFGDWRKSASSLSTLERMQDSRQIAIRVLDSNALDYVSAAILADELSVRRDERPLDTIQFANRCQVRNPNDQPLIGYCDGHVEIWDGAALPSQHGSHWLRLPLRPDDSFLTRAYLVRSPKPSNRCSRAHRLDQNVEEK